MLEHEALELIDAHLDGDPLSDDQVEALTAWLKQNPDHAKSAFHRMFLHTFLRRRLQAQRLPGGTLPSELTLSDASAFPPPPALIIPSPNEDRGAIRGSLGRYRSRNIIGLGLGIVLAVAGTLGYLLTSREELANAYDGFAYKPSSTPSLAPVDQSWPTTAGLQGLDRGRGWAEPWQESGSKVSVIVDHASEMNWDPKDMRKFKPLGHVDAQGRVLKTTGLQMRTAMGVRSMTSRKLDMESFPPAMVDETGLGRDGAVIWISFLAQSFNSAGENNRYTYFQIGSREVSGFRIGKIGAAPSGNWTATGLLTGAQVNLRSSTVPSGEMAFIVTRIEFRPGPEEATVWINPNLASEPKLAEANMRLSVPDFRFDGVTINANYSTDIDEIRIGTSFKAVAPSK